MIWATIPVLVALLLLAAARARWGRTVYVDVALGLLGVAIIALAFPGGQQGWLRIAEVVLGAGTVSIAGISLVRRRPTS